MDMDAAGGVVTGGVLASALEKPTGHAGEHHASTCSDCGSPVEGKFCSNCGQPTHVHRSLLHLGEELLHGVMHFDARIWRTLPLLAFNPGRLTREWVQGKRTRYVSPLAMFLFTVFLMFFMLSFSGGLDIQQQPLEERITALREAVTEAEAELAEAKAASTTDDPGADGVIIGAQAAVDGARQSLRFLEEARTAGPRADGLAAGSWQAEVADAAKEGRVTIGLGDKDLQYKILKKLSNPDLAFYKIQQTVYKYAFLLVPLSIPFVWLLFAWKRGFTWYDHGVFVLYSLTFMSLLGMVLSLFARGEGWLAGTLGTIAFFSIPLHMFVQLKGAYGLSIFSALWRTFFLLLFCTFVLTLFLVAILMLGLGV